MIEITPHIFIPEKEVKFIFIRSPGPGGQNVNKIASAAQLQFNVKNSSLPEMIRVRLLSLAANKISSRGDLIIKASRYRTQERNKQDALNRLILLIQRAATVPKKRKKTQPSFAAKQTRLHRKKLHGKTKKLRQKKPTIDY